MNHLLLFGSRSQQWSLWWWSHTDNSVRKFWAPQVGGCVSGVSLYGHNNRDIQQWYSGNNFIVYILSAKERNVFVIRDTYVGVRVPLIEAKLHVSDIL